MEQNFAANQALLEKYRANKTKRLLSQDDGYYVFEDRIVDTPTEWRQYRRTFSVDEAGEVYAHRETMTRQKFLCVNGPLAGQRMTEEHARDYILFNRASRPNRNKSIPKAVLVHRESLHTAPVSRKKPR